MSHCSSTLAQTQTLLLTPTSTAGYFQWRLHCAAEAPLLPSLTYAGSSRSAAGTLNEHTNCLVRARRTLKALRLTRTASAYVFEFVGLITCCLNTNPVGHPTPLATVVRAAPTLQELDLPLALGLLELGACVSSWPNYLHWQTSRTDITPEALSEAARLAAGKIPAADCNRVTALHSLCANPSVSAALVNSLGSVTEGVKSKSGTLPVTLLCRNPAVHADTLDAVLKGLPRGMSVFDCTGCAGIHDLCNNPSFNAELARVASYYDSAGFGIPDPEGRIALHLCCLRPGGGPDPDMLQVVLKVCMHTCCDP